MIPSTMLGYLAISECPSPVYEMGMNIWAYPCGLRITDKLVSKTNGIPLDVLGSVHRIHHEHETNTVDWYLVYTVETEETWVKQAITCSCKKEGTDA